ncbi:hypothetical protein [Parasitella parasitica]|uniref:Uncharacterized protein n=1 Tax=Parasitella parasitica TaxID=35722 RepID=A0A0B7NWS3_9FUNG|nr:hypothetical protein [Parasitella parasitica]
METDSGSVQYHPSSTDDDEEDGDGYNTMNDEELDPNEVEMLIEDQQVNGMLHNGTGLVDSHISPLHLAGSNSDYNESQAKPPIHLPPQSISHFPIRTVGHIDRLIPSAQ